MHAQVLFSVQRVPSKTLCIMPSSRNSLLLHGTVLYEHSMEKGTITCAFKMHTAASFTSTAGQGRKEDLPGRCGSWPAVAWVALAVIEQQAGTAGEQQDLAAASRPLQEAQQSGLHLLPEDILDLRRVLRPATQHLQPDVREAVLAASASAVVFQGQACHLIKVSTAT